jgi:hypothetical protein
MRSNILSLSAAAVADIKREVKSRFNVSSLLSIDSDPKTSKSNLASDEYLTAIQYLAPASLGGHNVCQWSTIGCRLACLHTSGNPIYLATKTRARLNRKQLFFEARELYRQYLVLEIERAIRAAERIRRRLAVRLNGTSDIIWERIFPELFLMFPTVQWYDYTKCLKLRVVPNNYDITYSRSESNESKILDLLARGQRAAIVFDSKRFPREYKGYRVHNGDIHDMTFTRASGWLGLSAKGAARTDQSGFVVAT